MSDLVDEIARVFDEHWVDHETHDTVAAAKHVKELIIARIPPLVWVTLETSAISTCGKYKVYELDSGVGGIFRAVHASFGRQYISDHRDSTDPRNAMKAAKAAANAHHVAQLCKGMGIE